LQSAVTWRSEVNHFDSSVMVHIGLTTPRAEVSLSPVIASLFTGSLHISSRAVYTATNAKRSKHSGLIACTFLLQILKQNKKGHVLINVILKRIRVTIVTVAKQKVL